MSGARFRFADFEADVTAGELRRGGFRVRLQDLPFRLLVALAERPGELVTRDELRKSLWPTESHGDFGHRLGGALNRLREALGDPADRPRVIETVPRRGYRFCAVVEPIGVEPIEPQGTIEPQPLAPAAARRGPRVALAAAVVVALSAGAWHVVPSPVAEAEAVRVAVLPFVDLSSGKPDERGREPGVSYVVEGSVSRGPRELRVTVRLLDARRQMPLWSEGFAGEASDPLALQARVAREVAQAVSTRLSAR